MAILRRKWWKLVVEHRGPSRYQWTCSYSEKDHADIAFRFAKAEKPSLFYKVTLLELFHHFPRRISKVEAPDEAH